MSTQLTPKKRNSLCRNLSAGYKAEVAMQNTNKQLLSLLNAKN